MCIIYIIISAHELPIKKNVIFDETKLHGGDDENVKQIIRLIIARVFVSGGTLKYNRIVVVRSDRT